MSRTVKTTAILALAIGAALPALAEDIDSLRGQFAFDWRTLPSKTKCAPVDDQLLAKFKSDAFSCDMEVKTNTASDEPARICSEKGETGAEFMIFATEKSCELERTAQESNEE